METNNKNVDFNELNMSGGANRITQFDQALKLLNTKETNNTEFQDILNQVIIKYNNLKPSEQKTVITLIQKSKHNKELDKKIQLLNPAPTPSPPSPAPTTPGNKTKYAFNTTSGITNIVQLNSDGTPSSTIKVPDVVTPDTDLSSGTQTSTNTEPEITDSTTGKTTQTTKIYIIDKDGNLTTDTKTTNKTPNKIERKTKDAFKTETGVDYSVPENIDPDNNFLLELFDKNINNLVIDLKKHFGDNNKEVNEVVAAISTITSGIKTKIDDNVSKIPNKTDDYENDQLIKVTNPAKGIYESNLKNQEKQKLFTTDPARQTEINKIKSLDDDTSISNYNAELEADYTNLNDTVGIAKVETRLRNCQALELIHLGLYENFMKTGAFTLTLFEKYKYVTNVMLYLLKNLVNKPGVIEGEQINIDRSVITENGCVEQPKIKLPRSIIKNIAELVAEQGKIQGTIDSIDTALQKTSMDNLMDYRVGDFEDNLTKTTSPDDPSPLPNSTATLPFTTGPITAKPPKLEPTT